MINSSSCCNVISPLILVLDECKVREKTARNKRGYIRIYIPGKSATSGVEGRAPCLFLFLEDFFKEGTDIKAKDDKAMLELPHGIKDSTYVH